ncbi:MAG TPA: GNAT family N-acetyltransferase [Tepidiformaceae bacterium]|jgi:RimJ/RimL family protein N-acetyltransferase
MTRDTEQRRATVADAGAIATIVRGLGAENIGIPKDFDNSTAEQWVQRLGDNGTIVIAFDGSIPVAFGALDFNTTEPDTGVLGVWVIPSHRRRGLATDIADTLLEFAREKGYRRIRGRLPDSNEPALSFLSGIGAMVPLRNPNMRFELPL